MSLASTSAVHWYRQAHWNQDGFKTGLCNVPPIGLDYSLMGLFNTTGIAPFLGCVLRASLGSLPLFVASMERIVFLIGSGVHCRRNVRSRFQQLFRARAHMHHYTSWASVDDFVAVREAVCCGEWELSARLGSRIDQ